MVLSPVWRLSDPGLGWNAFLGLSPDSLAALTVQSMQLNLCVRFAYIPARSVHGVKCRTISYAARARSDSKSLKSCNKQFLNTVD